MGTRIGKSMGYFLPKNKMKNFIVDNYEEKFEEFDYDETIDDSFYKNLCSLVDQYKVEDHFDGSKSNKHMIDFYLKYYDKNKWSPSNLVEKVIDYDDFVGINFLTPTLEKNKRHNDDIDYYEASETLFNVNYFFRPIYPCSGYIYTGGLENNEKVMNYFSKLDDEDTINFKKGCIVDNHDISIILHFLNGDCPNDNHKYAKALKATGVLHPNVEPFVYLIAKASGILAEQVDEYTFRTTVQPAILTTWG